MGILDGKVAIVLGASAEGNIGQAVARRFAREGASVMISGRREESLCKLAVEIGGDYQVCDITRETEVNRLVNVTSRRFGGVDIGVNATGWGLYKPFLETTRQELEDMAALQFIGLFQYFQALVRAMARGGSIIQISTVTAKIVFENHAAYVGTKAGMDHIIRGIANEFGERGIRANSISPGLTDTPGSHGACGDEALIDAVRRRFPLGRLGNAEDIANAAVWLASDEAFITGENLQINGGVSLRNYPRPDGS